tara:strand:- start:1267 stop:1788 length:522 start_codon:yes stop_codon:yes gene_type:complete
MAQIEYGGVKASGSKLLLLIPMLTMLGGVLWGGFEFYKDYMNMRDKIEHYTAPDLSGIEKSIAVFTESLVSIEDSVSQAKDYTRSIKNDLKDDMERIEKLTDRLEDKVNESETKVVELIDIASDKFDNKRDEMSNELNSRRDALFTDTDRKIKDLEDRLTKKLQRALDNPLAN